MHKVGKVGTPVPTVNLLKLCAFGGIANKSWNGWNKNRASRVSDVQNQFLRFLFLE
jgi:hypothetical protein